MKNDANIPVKVFEYKGRYKKYILGAFILTAITFAITYVGHIYLSLLVLIPALIGMLNEYVQDRREPYKLVLHGQEIRVYWPNRSLSFNLSDFRVEETGSSFHSNKYLKFYTGGHIFKVYQSIDEYGSLKARFIEPTPSLWDKDISPWKGKKGT